MMSEVRPSVPAFGSLVRRERESRGWTLADLAARSGIPEPNLSRLERGLADVRVSTAQRVAVALGLQLSLVPTRPRQIDEVVRTAAAARERILAAGLAESDPWARLRERRRRGADTRVESAAWTGAEGGRR